MFNEFRDKYLKEIDSYLEEFLKTSRMEQKVSVEMTSYHFETGGKRLRALIPLYVYQVLGHSPLDAIPLGAAVEMIHNATLVHDDLQDGDEVRRDQATIWKKYSPAQAINCGDAMFQFAFRLLVNLRIEPASLVKLVDRTAKSTLSVIEGQAQEFLMKEEKFPGLERYIGVIRGKTSGLFALPIVGAMEAIGSDPFLCGTVESAAMDLGMLFQIQDDVLDIYGKKGRGRIATDIAEGKISFFVAHINEVASSVEKMEMHEILAKPRESTTQMDIQRAIAIFEKNHSKEAALEHIHKIQNDIKSSPNLKKCTEIHRLLIELGELFLEPVNGLL